VQRPLPGSLLLGLLPFLALTFTVSLWDRIDPMVLGLPFNFFWILLWLLLTPVCLSIAYRLEDSRTDRSSD
jgi:hypothetical protein